MKYISVMCVLVLMSIQGEAQFRIQSLAELGENNISEGTYVQSLSRVSYQANDYKLAAGMLFDLRHDNPNTLSGIEFRASKEFLINDFPIEIESFYILNRFSGLLNETNWGLLGETRKLQHFLFAVGTYFRTFTITSKAREEYDIVTPNHKISENFNLMYKVGAFAKPHSCRWNVGVLCANFDYYLFNQSTNPFFGIKIKHDIVPNLDLYLESWYKQAGIMNIQANYFGYFYRGGVLWTIR